MAGGLGASEELPKHSKKAFGMAFVGEVSRPVEDFELACRHRGMHEVGMLDRDDLIPGAPDEQSGYVRG